MKKPKNPYKFIHGINTTDTVITELLTVDQGFVTIRQTRWLGNTCRQTEIVFPVIIVKKLEEYYEKFKPT